MPNGIFYLKSLDKSISYIRGIWIDFLLLLLSCFVEISEFNANRVDPDQTPRSAASDLDLPCLSMSHLWDARLKWIKANKKSIGFKIFAEKYNMYDNFNRSL